MQNGPRFLTDFDINQAYVYTNLLPGGGGGSSNSTNQTASGLTIDFTNLGQIGQTADGRLYRLCTIGGTSTVAAGSLVLAQARSTNFAGLAIPSTQPSNTATGNGASGSSALAKGSLSFNITNGGSAAITADQFAGGFVEVLQTSGTSEGPVSYKLVGNTADASSGHNGTVTLYLAEPLDQPEALVAGTDTVNLVPCPYAAVTTSSTLGLPAGILTVQAPNTSSVTYAAWVQTHGNALGNEDSTASVAFNPLGQSTTTAGDTTKWTASTGGMIIGYALKAATSAAQPIFLTID